MLAGSTKFDVNETRVAVDAQESVIAAVVPTAKLKGKNLDEVRSVVSELKSTAASPLDQNFDAICFPHDLIRFNQDCFAENLEFLLSQGTYQKLRDGLFLSLIHI